MSIEKPNYLKFIVIAMKLSKLFPEYSSKYSRKDFTQYQLMTLYILKQKSKLSYDEFVDDFKTRDSAIIELRLRKVPSASTIKMFVRRTNPKILEVLIADCIKLTRKQKLDTAIDSTGFELEDGSYSYYKRLGLSSKKRKNLKFSGCAETNKHLFTAVKIRKSNKHDSKDFKPLISKTKKNTGRKIRVSVGDKAYDSEELHEFAEKNGFEHIAPLKNKVAVWRTKGKHRKKLRRKFPEKRYHRRSIIENMFYCVKRLCGKVIYAKRWIMQRKEMLARILAYNIHRLVKLLRV